VGLLATVRDDAETPVHPSAQPDAAAAPRHRAIIAARVLGGIVALAACLVYLIARGVPGAIALIVFVWPIAPMLAAYLCCRSGRREPAHALVALAWTAAAASTFAIAAAGLLVLLGAENLLPLPVGGASPALAALGIVSAILFGTGLALGTEVLARTGVCLRGPEEDRYRLLACDMTDVITRHASDGAVLFISPAAQSLFGFAAGDLYGQGLFDRVHVADRPAYLTALGDAACLAENRSVEFRVRRGCADGDGHLQPQFVWVEMRCRPLELALPRADPRHRREVVAVLRDVSERKKQELALEQARAEAERANAAKSRFLATMSHELRTPLNAIIGFSEMLMKEAVLVLNADRRTEYAGLINESGHHLLAVINGILDMSKIETDNFEITPESFAPAQVVAACCDLLALRAGEAGVRLDRSVPDELPEIIADKRALSQILLNLLSNAIRFTNRGGKVTISARAEAAAIAFTVEDSGVGISDADLVRLGEPYFQAAASYDRRHGGTGLGLSIVKGLVRLHGGEFSIHSRLGEGTRVAVRLPLDYERAGSSRKHPARASDQAMSRLARLPPQPAINAAPSTSSLAGREPVPPPSDLLVKKSA
jgi:two-component system, cell cycle sensor histidine kinase DivJ